MFLKEKDHKENAGSFNTFLMYEITHMSYTDRDGKRA